MAPLVEFTLGLVAGVAIYILAKNLIQIFFPSPK